MAISKITLNGVTQMDVTNNTVDEDNLLYGETATKANGVGVTGAVVTADIDDTLSIAGDAADAKATGDAVGDLNTKLTGSYPSISTTSGTWMRISENTDYNNITTPGTYICLSSSDAGTMSHCPVSVAHKLFVIAVSNIDRLCQIVIANDLNMVVYKRYYLYSWGEWKKEAYTSEVDAIYTATKVTSTINNTYSGITLSAQDNETLKIYGTASATRRYLFLNGQNAEMVLASAFSQTLPAGTYKITASASGEMAFDINSFAMLYTYTTFQSINVLASTNTTFEYTFTSPVMIGFYAASGTNFGTSENPTYLKFKAEQLSGIPYPAAPQTNGTYTLQCTVSGGAATYSWVSV